MVGSRRSRQAGSWSVALASGLVLAAVQWPLAAQQTGGGVTSLTLTAAPGRACQLRGTIRSGEAALAGATVTFRSGDRVSAVTSTDVDGTYIVLLDPGTYAFHVELSAFGSVDRAVIVHAPPCAAVVDASLSLLSRTPGAPASAAAGPAPSERTAPTAAPAAAGRFARAGGPGGRGGGAARFQSLSVQQSSTAAEAPDTALDVTGLGQRDDPALQLLPPGFSPDAAQEAVTVSGSMVTLDRGLMNDRMDALARGEFGLGQDQPLGDTAQARLGGPGGVGGRGLGGRGGRGGFGGRGAGMNRLQASATYGLGGSMFDAAPYSLRGEPTQKPTYLQQSASMTVGGPVKIPGVYDGTNRTTFNFSYTAGRNRNLFDQYATVPGEALRSGDFSASPVAIIDPQTNQPFPDNQIPQSRISPAALALLRFMPAANLSGDTRNYHVSKAIRSNTDQFTLRLTHTLTQPQAGRGGFGGRGGGFGRGGGAAGGRGGAGGRAGFQAPLNVTVNGTISYRRNSGDQANVFPLLGGTRRGSTLSAPLTLNIRKGRSFHNIGVSFSRTTSTTVNPFTGRQDIAAGAGIVGVSTNPFDYGVPSLTFGTFTGVRDTSPARRNDHSWQVSYGWTHPAGTHNIRFGGSYEQLVTTSQSDSNAQGTFTFTGLYTSGGLSTVRGGGQDFADFLLGLPQQATRQYSISPDNISTPITIRGRQFSLYAQDDWRLRAGWTINYGVQYDFVAPFTETDGHMVNLDVAPGFTAAAPVDSGGVGPFTGAFPAGLVNPDWNNVAPRVGVAWRATSRSVVRAGYGLAYNSGSYSTIARNLYQQPPFFETATSLGTLADPLSLANAFAVVNPSTVTNNYGIDKNYQLGLIHQWTADYSRNLFRTWNVGATYIGTRGAHLDMLRAPNRGPDGPRIPDVQSFIWQSSDGSSRMNGLALRLQKRQSHGVSGNLSYTLSKSRDDTTATSGNATVAQNDRNLNGEWGLSTFDRRHQLAGTLNVELPWGRSRHWLSEGGLLATIVGDWSMSAVVNWQSGTPLTVRCSSCAADVAQGVVGTLRANYNGAPIALLDPTINEFFNTSAFSIPVPGTFGTSGRNIVIGPGSHVLNMRFTRDVFLGGARSMSINVDASNLLNIVNFASVDTNVNSPTFGEVLSVNGRRSVRLNVRFRF